MPGRVVVWAVVDLPGYHRWPDAPQHRAYLASRHRHLFRVSAQVPVSHDGRETEFHDLDDAIRLFWGHGDRDWGDASCETIARALAEALAGAGIRPSTVEVSEDGQAGAIYYPEEAPGA